METDHLHAFQFMTTILDQYGIPRNISHINAVERLCKLKETSGSDPWPVVAECFKIWKSTSPKEWESYLYEYIPEIKESRKDEFASTTDPVTGGILRYTIDIPQKVVFMLRTLYTPDELPMDKKFMREFAKHYPALVIPKKL